MIHFSLILLHHNMGIKYVQEPFNVGMCIYLRRPSKWVHFQTPNTQIRAFLYWCHPLGSKPYTYSHVFSLTSHIGGVCISHRLDHNVGTSICHAHTSTHTSGPCSTCSILYICSNRLFRVVKTTLSSSYNISGLVPVCWLLFQCF